MLLLNNKQLLTIVDELDSGMLCYIHKKTGKTIFSIDLEDGFYTEMDEEYHLWANELKPVTDHPDDYYKLEKMSSHESYEIMERFIETVSDSTLQNRLLDAINKRKPFRHFGEVIHSSDERENWFKFKRQAYADWVAKEIDYLNEEELENHSSEGENTQDDKQSPNRSVSAVGILPIYRPRSIQFYELVEIEDWNIKVYTLSEKRHHPFSDMVEAAIAELPDWLEKITIDFPVIPYIAVLIIHETHEGNVLSLNWWLNPHVLQQQVYLSSLENPTTFTLSEDQQLLSNIWDMNVLWHERNAWVKHILQKADNPNFDVYLADTLEGEL